MSIKLQLWFTTGISATEKKNVSSDPGFPNPTISPPSDEEDGSDTETEQHDDSPPAFPSLLSAQRTQSSAPTDAQRMPPPPLPQISRRNLGATSSLTLPPSTSKRPPKKREKIALAPGHSPLDWAKLKASGRDLRGVETLMRITPSMLKQHNKRDDAWSAINDKVYNVTPYLSFHPGGEKELMRVAGRDGTKLFASTHSWVNVDFMLDSCLVGFLIAEHST